MTVDIESFQDVLKHPIRRKIIQALNQTPNLSYTDLMDIVEVSNTGKFNYHLKILADLIQKDESGKYTLTEKGHLAVQFLQTFKEKKAEPSPLCMADALLIGFVGFALTLMNVGFWGFMWAASAGIKSLSVLVIISACITVYGIIVPGAVMWRLAVRRSHSHDFYDLFKPAILTFTLLVLLLALMLVFSVNIGTQVEIPVGPTITGGEGNGSWSSTSYIELAVGLPQIAVTGMVFGFLGVGLAEFASRLKKRLKC
ncbi:MAG: winged helix-turn-helix domain-containing protein [Nitrososphaerota archaeon]|jgi:hypothetical protein|nr:winged helix-turn-helix domain-containing protein [Nitrososphaerota archaeon]